MAEGIQGGTARKYPVRKYKPQPVRRAEIPKFEGKVVKRLGIPTVIDRIIQQAMMEVREYAEQGYTHTTAVDLSKYFDTIGHEQLMNLTRKQIHDGRVAVLIKKYLKSGVMKGGMVRETKEGSPQGGHLSPLLANIYLNEFDQEMGSRGVPVIRYTDDIIVL